MALFVYAPVIKQGTRELIEALGAKRLVRFDGLNFVHKGTPLKFDEVNDTIICWGACVPQLGKVRMFNDSLIFTGPLQMNEAMSNSHQHYVDGWRVLAIRNSLTRVLPNQFYFRDQIHGGNMVPYKGYLGKAQQFSGMKNEYRITIFDGEVLSSEKKYPLFRVHNADHDEWLPERQLSHSWYRGKAGHWEWRPCKEKVGLENVIAAVNQFNAKFLELDYFTITVGTNNIERGFGANIFRKINVSPELDADGVQMYLNLIQKWIKKNGGSIVP